MDGLLELYRSKYGEAVKKQGDGWNGPCPLCGGEPGKSDRFVVWPEKTQNLGKACSEHGIKGIWWCRQCGHGGDTIAFLQQVLGFEFKEALAYLSILPEKYKNRIRRSAPIEPIQARYKFEPKKFEQPTRQWQYRAKLLVEEAEKAIWNIDIALRWLERRGINAEAVSTYRLGYLVSENEKCRGRFRPRSVFGLAPKTGSDGKSRDKLFIPRGLLIPTFGEHNEILNLRIRRRSDDLTSGSQKHFPKYLELEGSQHSPLILESSRNPQAAVYFVVEAELDAILIHHASSGEIGAIAVRTNLGKPCARAHKLLKDCARVCIALDYDPAGAAGCEFWEKVYPHSKRWPTPIGKDPGDAFSLGADIREWLEASLPGNAILSIQPPKIAELTPQNKANSERITDNHCGQADICVSGRNNLGERGRPKNIVNRPPKKQEAAWTEPLGWLDGKCGDFLTMPLPERTRHEDLLEAFADSQVGDPDCLLPCPKTAPSFWWIYWRDCKKFKCAGHPQCLRAILQSPQFKKALQDYKKRMAKQEANNES